MKKMYSLVLALLLAVTLPVSVRAAEAADILGDWYGSMFGINVTLTLEEGGTYTLAMPIEDEEGEPTTGTWELKEDKIIMDGDETSPITIDGETLLLGDEEMSVTFTREPAETFTPAEAKTDATVEEYAGGWIAQYVSMFGMTLDTAVADMNLVAQIDGTEVALSSTAMDLDEKIPFEFADGALSINADTLKAIAEENSIELDSETLEDVSMKLQLLQDGMMEMNMTYSGESVVFYLKAATAEEIEAVKAAAAETEVEADVEGILEGLEEALEEAEEGGEDAE